MKRRHFSPNVSRLEFNEIAMSLLLIQREGRIIICMKGIEVREGQMQIFQQDRFPEICTSHVVYAWMELRMMSVEIVGASAA